MSQPTSNTSATKAWWYEYPLVRVIAFTVFTAEESARLFLRGFDDSRFYEVDGLVSLLAHGASPEDKVVRFLHGVRTREGGENNSVSTRRRQRPLHQVAVVSKPTGYTHYHVSKE